MFYYSGLITYTKGRFMPIKHVDRSILGVFSYKIENQSKIANKLDRSVLSIEYKLHFPIFYTTPQANLWPNTVWTESMATSMRKTHLLIYVEVKLAMVNLLKD